MGRGGRGGGGYGGGVIAACGLALAGSGLLEDRCLEYEYEEWLGPWPGALGVLVWGLWLACSCSRAEYMQLEYWVRVQPSMSLLAQCTASHSSPRK